MSAKNEEVLSPIQMYSKYRYLLDHVHAHSGLTLKELREFDHKARSVTAMSKLVSRFVANGLINKEKEGRFKRLYTSPLLTHYVDSFQDIDKESPKWVEAEIIREIEEYITSFYQASKFQSKLLALKNLQQRLSSLHNKGLIKRRLRLQWTSMILAKFINEYCSSISEFDVRFHGIMNSIMYSLYDLGYHDESNFNGLFLYIENVIIDDIDPNVIRTVVRTPLIRLIKLSIDDIAYRNIIQIIDKIAYCEKWHDVMRNESMFLKRLPNPVKMNIYRHCVSEIDRLEEGNPAINGYQMVVEKMEMGVMR